MTTFHELLGTDDSSSAVDIKKRYRQLSVKLHPDKGGSQVLMQMLSMAYQQVLKGKGNQKCSDIIIRDDQCHYSQQQKSVDLKGKIELLIKEKSQLQSLVEHYQCEAKQAYCTGENSARQALVLLQATNNTLNEQISQLRRKIAEEATKIVLPVTITTYKKHYIGMICVVLVIIIAVVGWFIWHYQTQHSESQLLESMPVYISAQEESVIATHPTTIENAVVVNHVDKIMKMDAVGLWQQRYYEGTRQPYIAVRSIDGSYIVKDCQEQFSYYANRAHNTGHVAANLIFSTNDRQFSVYRIPYGNGSSDQQWLNSQSLSINNTIFSNNGYKLSALALMKVCNNMMPF